MNQRKKLSDKGGDNCDVLLMSATPIPRTMMMSIYGDMDSSKIKEKPAKRKIIKTLSKPESKVNELWPFIKKRIEDGEQIFWVCPLVKDSEKLDLAAAETRHKYLNNIFPNEVAIVHGQMDSRDKENALVQFSKNEKKILVSTTVIEVGIDIPNATIMIIEHAERFGLAQLHQLRGRIGRGTKKSVCILLYDQKIGEIARERLTVMRETNNGFEISEKDLKLRGAGEILGTRQSGGQMFKILDINRHENLIKIANKNSKLIINQNPSLIGEEGEKLNITEGNIVLDKINFAYKSNPENKVLQDMSLKFTGGKMTALVGHSGSGKSTLLNMIPRIYLPTSGNIYFDNQDISKVNLDSLRNQISIVDQNTTLFDDTVLNNIKYARPDASDEEVYEAAKLAMCEDFINNLEKGYDEMIGENGVRLSGGEKQRLSIARAFLKKSKIILLDEATSSLDSETEEKIQKALEDLTSNKTTIVIAHRSVSYTHLRAHET